MSGGGPVAPDRPVRPGERAAIAGAGVGGLGSAIAVIAGSLCCVGPASVAVLGVGGAVAAAGLKPYRPELLLGSLALLGFGFWRTYHPTLTAAGSCPPRVGRSIRIVLWLGALVWVFAAILPSM